MAAQSQFGNQATAGIPGAPADVPQTSPKTSTIAHPPVFGIALFASKSRCPRDWFHLVFFPAPVPVNAFAPATVLSPVLTPLQVIRIEPL